MSGAKFDGWFECNFFTSKERIVWKLVNKNKLQSPMQNRADIYGAPVFAPDYSATILVVKMWTNNHEHSI